MQVFPKKQCSSTVIWKNIVFLDNHWLLNGNLVDTVLMTATLKLCREVFVHNLARQVLVNEPTGHHQHVGIVVLTDEVGNLRNPAQAGTDALMLVQRHVDAFARAADGNAGEHLALLDATSQGMAEVAVVAGILGVSAVVLVGVALFFKVFLDELFKRIASVIAGYAYCLDVHCYASSFFTCS